MLLMNSLEGFETQLRHANKSESTIRSYLMSCKRFIDVVQAIHNSPIMLKQVKEEDIQHFLHYLKHEKNYKPASLNVTLNGLRNLFQYAMRNELIEKDPTRYLEPAKEYKQKRDFLTMKEVQTLLAAIDHELGALVVRTLAYTGLRISECLALTMDDIDFEKDRIYVRNGKGNKPRTLPLSKDLKSFLLQYKEGPRCYVKDSNFFFATSKSGRISAVYINRLLTEAVKKLKWKKHVTCHTLRHSFASRLVKNGTGLPTVAALLGHSDFRTVTSVYVHIEDAELQSAVDQLTL
ncbi:hypothetical protein AC623_18200 [Bacillus sp. FJAT-27231]|uniref:tyrosine-type recombinase/integrase n=1 Tax=Bacillus sp. FJAT-27231 TaxID=1679168 RepID=UPI0006712E6C|nr:tyrosine-type recombinase/integrase [Bacillus sp. FJAT-27231]KMY55622.1 hypothetical protein AC623_18200 [Bacillus sp. FJAT-27231]